MRTKTNGTLQAARTPGFTPSDAPRREQVVIIDDVVEGEREPDPVYTISNDLRLQQVYRDNQAYSRGRTERMQTEHHVIHYNGDKNTHRER